MAEFKKTRIMNIIISGLFLLVIFVPEKFTLILVAILIIPFAFSVKALSLRASYSFKRIMYWVNCTYIVLCTISVIGNLSHMKDLSAFVVTFPLIIALFLNIWALHKQSTYMKKENQEKLKEGKQEYSEAEIS